MAFPNIAPGIWYEVPNSRIDAHLPSPLPPGSTGPSTIVTGWSGGCYDSARDELMVTGGGHGDYAGNEQYRFSFSTMAWTRAWGPTPNADIPPVTAAGGATYNNGDPASRHTYTGVVYMPNINKTFICGGSMWGGSGGMGKDVWLWTPTAFERKKDIAFYPYGTPPYAAYDPQTGHVFMHRYNRIGEWDHVTDVWTQRGSWDAGGTPSAGTVIDPVGRRFYLIGGGAVRSYALTGTGVTNKIRTDATTGPQNIVNAAYPGVEWDATSGKIYGWSGGSAVYALNTATLAWTQLPLSPANTVTPTAQPSQGTHGRWRYVSAHDCYVVVNSISQNVYLFRPDRGTSAVTIQVAGSITAKVQ